MKLPDAKMILGFKIGALVLRAMKGDAQGAALEVLDDFDKSDSKDDLMGKLIKFLMDRYNAEEVILGATDKGLEISIIGGDNVLEHLDADIQGMMRQLKTFLPNEEIKDKFMELVTIEEVDETCTLKIEINDGVVNKRLKEVI